MERRKRFLSGAMLMAMAMSGAAAQQAPKGHWAIVVHGGAGDITPGVLGPEGEAAYRASLAKAEAAGAAVLDKGGSALDAVETTINVLEDDPLFNAGKGAVFTSEGKNEMDSAIMDGATLRAGAVAGVTKTKNPISLARAVMEKSPYVMMIGAGADAFGARNGLPEEPASYFFTEARWQSLVKQLAKDGKPIPPRPEGVPADGKVVPVAMIEETPGSHRYGTVGAVALDRMGNIAAGTSTGGMQGKMPGRVGDSPIIGAGTYASNRSCAVSATGSGEYFIRLGVAREVCNLVKFKGMTLQQAADAVIHTELPAIHGEGGVIAITPDGQLVWSFNTAGMFRARQKEGGPVVVGIYKTGDGE